MHLQKLVGKVTGVLPVVPTNDSTAVEREAQTAYLVMFPQGDSMFVPRAFGWAIQIFTGHYRDYQAVDALYHDFEHTLQGTLCLVRLLRGRSRAHIEPVMTERSFQLALCAILLHDTGYLKKLDDLEGTGAKYTVTHVTRSAEFAARFLVEKGFTPAEIRSVQNMIRCTGVMTKLEEIPFQSKLMRILGLALATADLLGQMAAPDYIEKLPELYSEFAEAARFSRDPMHFVAQFNSATELIQRTPLFWRDFVRSRLEHEFCGLYQFLNDPYPDGENEYLVQIEANIQRLEKAGRQEGAARELL